MIRAIALLLTICLSWPTWAEQPKASLATDAAIVLPLANGASANGRLRALPDGRWEIVLAVPGTQLPELRFFWLSVQGTSPLPPLPPLPPPDLTGLAGDVLKWSNDLVKGEGRMAEAMRLASCYRVTADLITEGKITTAIAAQDEVKKRNRETLNITTDGDALKNRWYPLFLKIAEALRAVPPDQLTMPAISEKFYQIAKGLEAVR